MMKKYECQNKQENKHTMFFEKDRSKSEFSMLCKVSKKYVFTFSLNSKLKVKFSIDMIFYYRKMVTLILLMYEKTGLHARWMFSVLFLLQYQQMRNMFSKRMMVMYTYNTMNILCLLLQLKRI